MLHKGTVRCKWKGSTGFTKQEGFRFLDEAFLQEGGPDGHRLTKG